LLLRPAVGQAKHPFLQAFVLNVVQNYTAAPPFPKTYANLAELFANHPFRPLTLLRIQNPSGSVRYFKMEF
jgi:hypothetical protein